MRSYPIPTPTRRKNWPARPRALTRSTRYPGIYSALKDRDPARFLGTLEFYPEEGKYHYDGHRKCSVCYKPAQTLAAEGICPVCGRKLTVGVLHRVEKLADRPEGFRPEIAPSYEYLIPLDEVIGAAVGVGPKSKKVRAVYDRLLAEVGTELEVLRRAGLEAIESCAGPLVAEGVRRMRCGEVDIYPGHDGEYGVISVFSEEERERLKGQGALFDLGPVAAKTAEEVHVPAVPSPRPASTEQAEQDPDAPDDAQRQVEEAEGGPLVVVAGPGSGKTRVLTRRIARLVASGVDPGQIMAITFTRRAAGQMRQRLSALLGGGLGAMQVGTFHRLALSLLRELGCEPKLVLDEVEARRLLEGALADAGLSGAVTAASQAISLAKAAAQGPDAIAEEWRSHYGAYQAALHASGACDYDDILLDLLRLLEGDAAVREQVRARFPYLLIDEFQDLNAAQYRLVLQLAGGGAGLMAIGDPDQAIYSFRGASPDHFVHLRDRFSDTQLFHLGANYRSQGHIVEAAAAVVGHNPEREAIELAAMCPGKERIRLIEVQSETAEGIAVVREIARMDRRHRYGADRCWRRGHAQFRRLCRALPHWPTGPSAGGVLPQGGPAVPTRRAEGLSASASRAGRIGICPLRRDLARGHAPLAGTRGHGCGIAHFAPSATRGVVGRGAGPDRGTRGADSGVQAMGRAGGRGYLGAPLAGRVRRPRGRGLGALGPSSGCGRNARAATGDRALRRGGRLRGAGRPPRSGGRRADDLARGQGLGVSSGIYLWGGGRTHSLPRARRRPRRGAAALLRRHDASRGGVGVAAGAQPPALWRAGAVRAIAVCGRNPRSVARARGCGHAAPAGGRAAIALLVRFRVEKPRDV